MHSGFLGLLWPCALLLATAAEYKQEEVHVRFKEQLSAIRGVSDNSIIQGVQTVSNWTSRSLGKLENEILLQCTKPTYQGEKLCARVPMPSPWSSLVDLEAPLPEYPRPQLRRGEWLNLNGIWSFKSRGVMAMQNAWDEEEERPIVVPFPVEAPLSGVGSHSANSVQMQYKRNFTLPDGWTDKNVLLHFDAVDHTATVYLNGQKLGTHQGGYDRFSFDVTAELKQGSNEVLVEVFDPTEFAHIPIGKQRLRPPRHPSSIWYTSTSGIWQTVWLEPVPAAYIERLELIPDVDESVLRLVAHGSQAAAGKPVKARVTAAGKTVVSAEGTVGSSIDIKIPKPKLWSPDDPFLYDLDVSLGSDAKGKVKETDLPSADQKAAAAMIDPFPSRTLASADGLAEQSSKIVSQGTRALGIDDTDSVASYFAMRKSSKGHTADGALRPLLNNEFVFQTGMLDQGFWPDGLYTPASDEALIFDLQFAKELGFNMLRKHTKVESERWYYHADRLGVLVWQDMPAMFYESGPEDLSLQDKAQFKTELQKMIQQHFNSPSIVAWVIFNEGWGQHETLEVVSFAQKLDTTRIMDAASGWVDQPVGDLIDMHNYVGPGSPHPTESRAAVLGEFGGLGMRVEGHMWVPEDAFAYEMHSTGRQLEERFTGLAEKLEELMVDPEFHLSAAVYTELADVEAEINGWCTYDRQVKKVDAKVLRSANERLIAQSTAWNETSGKVASGGHHNRSSQVVAVKKAVGKAKSRFFGAKPHI